MTLSILSAENIVLNQAFTTKEEAIRFTGKVLVDRGYVAPLTWRKCLNVKR